MRLRSLHIVCLAAFLSLASSVFAQTNNASLLLVEYEEVNHLAEIQHLVRYNFKNGALVSRDTILTSKEVRFDLGNNRIFQNRYVINNWGDVVDIKTKSLVHEGVGEFVAIDGTRVIEHVNSEKVRGYFYYDVQSHRSGRLSPVGKWRLPGTLSPDHRKSVAAKDGAIWLYYLNGRKRILGRGFDVGLSVEASEDGETPVLWLCNQEILTQRSNGELVILRLDGKITPVANIPISTAPYTSPTLEIDDDGRVLYSCSDVYVVNVAGRSYSPYRRFSLGHGFYRSDDEQADAGHYYLAGREIGRWKRAPASTSNGYIAIEHDPGKFQSYHPSEVKVWNNISNQWTRIEMSWLARMIGWIPG